MWQHLKWLLSISPLRRFVRLQTNILRKTPFIRVTANKNPMVRWTFVLISIILPAGERVLFDDSCVIVVSGWQRWWAIQRRHVKNWFRFVMRRCCCFDRLHLSLSEFDAPFRLKIKIECDSKQKCVQRRCDKSLWTRLKDWKTKFSKRKSRTEDIGCVFIQFNISYFSESI